MSDDIGHTRTHRILTKRLGIVKRIYIFKLTLCHSNLVCLSEENQEIISQQFESDKKL